MDADGTQVAYLADADAGMQRMVMNAGGSNPTVILTGTTTTP